MKYIILIVVSILLFLVLNKNNDFYQSTNKFYNLSEKELIYYQRLADRNNTNARIKLYSYYQFVKKDFNKSMEIIKDGALMGDPLFEYKYAQRLLNGIFLTKSTNKKNRYKKAVYYLKSAAKKGNKDAIIKLKELGEIEEK